MIEQKGKNQIRKSKLKLMKYNYHWNGCKFQFCWNRLELVYPKKSCKKNPLLYQTHISYIKDRKQTCHFVGHSKLKPIDYVALFKLQEHSAALTASIAYSTVLQKN